MQPRGFAKIYLCRYKTEKKQIALLIQKEHLLLFEKFY